MHKLNEIDVYNLFNSKTVALVGNSIALSNQCLGNIIDTHDVVCRINKGPLLTTDAEKYGNRTDVLFYSNYKIVDDDVFEALDSDTKFICYYNSVSFDRPTYKISKHFYNYIMEISGYEDANIERKKKIKFNKQPQWPTNGLVASCFILDCNPTKISLFGFDWNRHKTFYKPQQKQEKMHNWSLEKNYLRSQPDIEITEMLCPKL
jgi:hypothetical protein